MREVRLPVAQLGLIAVTRVLLGVGIGLLVARRLGRSARRRVGGSLVAIGAVSTVPLALDVLSRSREDRRVTEFLQGQF